MSREPRVEVQLVEGGPSDPQGPVPDAVDAGPADERVARRTSWLRPRTLVAGALVVAAGLAGTQAVLDARERAAYARFADVPGVVAPLSPDVEVLWRPETDHVGVLLRGSRDADGQSLGARFGETGVPSAVAFDPGTGERAWSVPLGAADTLVARTPAVPWVPCYLSA